MTKASRSAARAAFLAAAAAEPNGGSRHALGAALCIAASLVAGEAAAAAARGLGADAAAGAASLVIALVALAAIAPTLAAIAPLLHHRGAAGLWGAARRPQFDDVWRGMRVAAALSAVVIALYLALGALNVSEARPNVGLLLLLAPLIAAQATAEELFFRGYLLQATAGWARRGFVLWAAPSILCFALFHIGPNAPWYAALWPLVFGVFAAALVWRTGGLSVGIGFHVMHNWIAILAFSEAGAVSGVGPLRLAEGAPRVELFVIEILVAAGALLFLTLSARPERPASA